MTAGSTIGGGLMNKATAAVGPDTCFVARHPILDARQQVVGHELLFRRGERNSADVIDDGHATASVLNAALNVMGFNRLLGNGKAFVNFHSQTLFDGDYRLLPRERTVVELLETVDIDDAVIKACRQLKRDGYSLALDDIVDLPDNKDLVGMLDYAKVDFLDCDSEMRRELARYFSSRGIRLLAEKVESHEDFNEATRLGYELAQGYFFCQPQVVSGREIPASKQQCLALLREVNQLAVDYAAVEEAIKSDLSLSVKLLHYLNSAAMGISHRIESIRQAVALLGEREMRRWAALVATMCLGEDKSPQLVRVTLARARFCEQCAATGAHSDRAFDLFLAGLLSTLDAFLDEPLDDLLADMPLPVDLKASLLGADSPLGWILELAVACERGQFDTMMQRCTDLQIEPDIAYGLYHDASAWATQL
jgi:EAL and modified HD-GYP domain-containing signal transduction protein